MNLKLIRNLMKAVMVNWGSYSRICLEMLWDTTKWAWSQYQVSEPDFLSHELKLLNKLFYLFI